MLNIIHNYGRSVTFRTSHIVFSIVTIMLSLPATGQRATAGETHVPKRAAVKEVRRRDTGRHTQFARTTPHTYRVFLFDLQGTPVYAAGYTYHEGHVYSAQQVEAGVVPNEQTGQIYNAANVCIGYILPNA